MYCQFSKVLGEFGKVERKVLTLQDGGDNGNEYVDAYEF